MRSRIYLKCPPMQIWSTGGNQGHGQPGLQASVLPVKAPCFQSKNPFNKTSVSQNSGIFTNHNQERAGFKQNKGIRPPIANPKLSIVQSRHTVLGKGERPTFWGLDQAGLSEACHLRAPVFRKLSLLASLAPDPT